MGSKCLCPPSVGGLLRSCDYPGSSGKPGQHGADRHHPGEGIVSLPGDNSGQLTGELCCPGHRRSSGPKSRPGSGNTVDGPANQVSEGGSKVAYKRGYLESNRPRFEPS